MKNNKIKTSKKDSRFFTEFINRSGQDFMVRENPVNIYNKIPLLLKDIAFGNIDLEKYGKYFSPQLVNIMYDKTYDIAQNKYIYTKAIELYVAHDTNNDRAKLLLRKSIREANAYNILLYGIDALRNTGDLSILIAMAYRLKELKFDV